MKKGPRNCKLDESKSNSKSKKNVSNGQTEFEGSDAENRKGIFLILSQRESSPSPLRKGCRFRHEIEIELL